MTIQDYSSFSVAQKAALFDTLLAKGKVDPAHLLVDFSTTLASEVQDLVGLNEPVWTNPTTGKQASSVHAQFLALGFDTSKHWGFVVKAAKKLPPSMRAGTSPSRSLGTRGRTPVDGFPPT